MEWCSVSHPKIQDCPLDLGIPWQIHIITPPTKAARNQHLSRSNGTTAVRRSRDSSSKQRALRADQKPSTLLYHKPRSVETDVTLELVDSLARVNLTEGWLGLLPSRSEGDQTVLLATRAFMQAHSHVFGKRAVTRYACLRSYTGALSALRVYLDPKSLESLNSSLLSAALLYCCVTTLDPINESLSSHALGINAILSARARLGCEPNEMIRGVFYWHWKGTFHVPVALGRPSPFEGPYWADLDPVARSTLSSDVVRLRKVSQQLFVRLPRLIADVRSLRTRSLYDDTVDCVTGLAAELLALKDDLAENSILHRINVRKTADPANVYITPYSFHYTDATLFEAGIYYWQTRIMLNRLCIKIGDLLPYHHFSFDPSALRNEDERLGTNMVMSWEYSVALGLTGTWALCLGWIALWGATLEVASSNRQSLSATKVRPWILQRFNDMHAMYNVPAFGEDDMNEAAELLIGGPLTGFFVTGIK